MATTKLSQYVKQVQAETGKPASASGRKDIQKETQPASELSRYLQQVRSDGRTPAAARSPYAEQLKKQPAASDLGLYVQQLRSGKQLQEGIYTRALRQQRERELGGPMLYSQAGQQPEREPRGLYTQALQQMQQAPTLEQVRRELAEAEAQNTAAKTLYREMMNRNLSAAAQDPSSVDLGMAAELREAEQAKNEASRKYQEALARNEEASYRDRLAGTKTDLTSVIDLQRQRDSLRSEAAIQQAAGDLDGFNRYTQQAAAADARIEDVRRSLRAEGYTDGEINSLFGKLERDRNAEDTAQRFKERRAAAAERGTAGNLAINVGAGLASGVGYLDLLGQHLFGGRDEITGQKRMADYNSGAQDFFQLGEATMQGQMDKLLEKYGELDDEGNLTMNKKGQIAAGAYQLGASMGQSAAVAGLTALGAPCAMLLLSGSAATATTHQMHEQGFSDGAALLMGGISGAAEYVTEKIGMDELFKLRDVRTAKNVLKTALRNFTHQAMAEGGEEVLSTVINTMADVIVNGDKSELERRYRELLAQGMTQDQAQQIAAQEWLGGAWQDFYMGAISGGLFAGGGMAFQGIRGGIVDARTGRTILDQNQTQALLDMVNGLDAEISRAANVPGVTEQSGARELGAAYQGLERAQVMENMRQALAERGVESPSPALLSGLYAASQPQEQRLTAEEKKALQSTPAARELAREWRGQWSRESVPAPFEGVGAALQQRLEAKKTESENVFRAEQQEQRKTVIPYEDVAARTEAQNELHQKMVEAGTVVDVSDSVQANEEFYPDLRQMKRRDRTATLKEKVTELKGILRGYLNELKGVKYDFEINGSTIEARLYNTGINEVLEKLTQEKAGMLGNSDQIFRSAQYLYSTADKAGSPNISGWDYFYCPIKIGDDILGVRIAVRDVVTTEGTINQIYNWGIKRGDTDKTAPHAKEAPQTSVSKGETASSNPRLLGASDNSIRPSAEKSNRNFEGEGRASAEVTPLQALKREYAERAAAYQEASSRDSEGFDYAGELQWLEEADERIAEMEKAVVEQKETAAKKEAKATKKVSVENAEAELLENEAAIVEDDTGTYSLSIRQGRDGRYRAKIIRDGRAAATKSFQTKEEAAAFAQSYVEGQIKARTDIEMDAERSAQEPKPGPHWPTGTEYGDEIRRQKRNKAADTNTEALKDEIKRHEKTLQGLKSLENTPGVGLTREQKVKQFETEETLKIYQEELSSREKKVKEKREKKKTEKRNKPTQSRREAEKEILGLFNVNKKDWAELRYKIGGRLNEMWRTGKITEENRQWLMNELIEHGAGGMEVSDVEEGIRRVDQSMRKFAEKADLEVYLKDLSASRLTEERRLWEARLKRRVQERADTEARDKVMKSLQRLERAKNKAGPELKAEIEATLKDIDTMAKRLTIADIENLQSLYDAYERLKEEKGYIDESHPGNFIPKPALEKRLESLSKRHVSDMSAKEVLELGRTLAELENEYRTQGKMIGDAQDKTVEEYAKGVYTEVNDAKGSEGGFLHKWVMEEHLSPRRFLDMLGGWKDGITRKLAQSLEDGQTRQLDFQRRATQSLNQFLENKENRKWLKKASGKNAEWTSYNVVNGMSEEGATYKTIELTPMMKVSLYLHSRNMDNLRHIETGGIKIPNKKLYQKGNVAEAFARAEHVKLAPETVRKIAGELTNQERAFADELIKIFDGVSKDAINEVSMQLDGFERAGVDSYFPIESSRDYVASNVEAEARAGTVEGIGSIANERVHAGNPIILDDATEVLMRQIDKVSRYYGFAIPVRNFQAVYNYVFHEEGNAFAGSIKETIGNKWGSGALSYIDKILQDVQGGAAKKGGIMAKGLRALRGNLAGATLRFNPSVALSQTASYPGAAQTLGWDGLVAGLNFGKRVNPKLIEKYTPLYWARSQGNSTQEMSDYVGKQGLEKKLPIVMNWIQRMDNLTIRRLWAAAEYRVSKDNPGLRPGDQKSIDAGTDPFYQEVAKLFNRAVYDTQPNYNAMQRPQVLRSESDLVNVLTMFKTVPLQYLNMQVEAVGRLQAAIKSKDQAEIKKNAKYAADTFTGVFIANSLYNVVRMALRSFRDKDKDYRDEEGNLTVESVMKRLGWDMVEVFAGSIIGGAELSSLAQSLLTGKKWNAPEINVLSYFQDAGEAIGSVTRAVTDKDPQKTAKAIKDAAETLALGMGFPAKNIETYLKACVSRVAPIAQYVSGGRIKTEDWLMEYDNFFGGMDKSDLKGLDDESLGTAVGIVIGNRIGERLDKDATAELARLYSAGFTDVIPTLVPESFTFEGEEVEIEDRRAYSKAWGTVVGDNLEELLTSDEYMEADDKARKNLINKLYQYATVQARKAVLEEYNVTGNSTYGWTEKADAWMNAGVSLTDAIGTLTSSEDSGFEIKDAKKYGETWDKVVDSGLSSIIHSADYDDADEKTRKSMVNKLYQYATVQARKGDDPSYSVTGNSTYSWTEKADTCISEGMPLPDTIRFMTTIGGFSADKDEDGNSISGSKKEKVVEYIDSLDLTDAQKDVLYITVAGYTENSLDTAPWNGGSGVYTKGGKKKSGGGRGRRRSGSKKAAKEPAAAKIQIPKTRTGSAGGSGGAAGSAARSGSGKAAAPGGSADASLSLIQIIDRYYGGNALAAAADGGRKARQAREKVDFEL